VTNISLADTTLEKDYRQSKESLFSFGAPIFGQVKDETSIKSQDNRSNLIKTSYDGWEKVRYREAIMVHGRDHSRDRKAHCYGDWKTLECKKGG
ncbi:hypothetical protein Tco_0252294, partial [Tanacetum coccineum]